MSEVKNDHFDVKLNDKVEFTKLIVILFLDTVEITIRFWI